MTKDEARKLACQLMDGDLAEDQEMYVICQLAMEHPDVLDECGYLRRGQTPMPILQLPWKTDLIVVGVGMVFWFGLAAGVVSLYLWVLSLFS